MTTNKIALLLVEDNPAALALTHRFIRAWFPTITIHTATNPEEALALFKKHHHHIVVTDYRTPHVGDGIELARKVCERKRETVVIIVSADDLTDVLERTPDVDISAVIKKPFDIGILIEKVQETVTAITTARKLEAGVRPRTR